MSQAKQIVFAFVLLSSILISGCSKKKFYTWTINTQRSKAELVLKKADISIGDVVYLDNTSEKSIMENQDVILMVHGFGADKDNWLFLADKLADDYRIIAPDLPGHGDSIFNLSDKYTIENQAIWLNELMATLNIKKFHIIGNSMGSAISLKLTQLHPEKIISLALLNSGGVAKNNSEFVELLKKGTNRLIAASMKEFDEMINFVMEKPIYLPGPVFKVLADKKIARLGIDKKIFKDMNTDINKTEAFLSEIKKPTLIIWGKKDRVLNVENADVFHRRIEGSQKIILKYVGHVPMIEDPKKIGEYYTSFLLSCKRYY